MARSPSNLAGGGYYRNYHTSAVPLDVGRAVSLTRERERVAVFACVVVCRRPVSVVAVSGVCVDGGGAGLYKYHGLYHFSLSSNAVVDAVCVGDLYHSATQAIV